MEQFASGEGDKKCENTDCVRFVTLATLTEHV